MDLTARDEFKVGFLARCAALGMTPDQMLTTVKQAQDLVKSSGVLSTGIGHAADALGTIGKTVLGYGLPAAAIIPPVAGAIGGYGLAKATDIDDTDISTIKDQEVVDEYRRQAAKARRQKAMRDYSANRKRTGRIFL